MLISPVIPLMSIYVNLPQDVTSFVTQLPRLPSGLDIIIVHKEGCNSHHDFCVRRSKVLAALQWLITNNIYFSDFTINYKNLSTLPENDHLTNIPYMVWHGFVMLQMLNKLYNMMMHLTGVNYSTSLILLFVHTTQLCFQMVATWILHLMHPLIHMYIVVLILT